MKTKHYCRRCGEELGSDYGYCPVCRENKRDYGVEERYFPDDPKNKVYAVDCCITVCKCLKIEASSQEEAERAACELLDSVAFRRKTDEEMIRTLAGIGFQDAEEREFTVSGEADENGSIYYYY